MKRMTERMAGCSSAIDGRRARRGMLCSTAFAALLAMPHIALAQAAPSGAADEGSTALADVAQTQEIVVTGTSIRGVAPVGSNLISVGRAAIENTGAVNTAEMLSTIPQLNSFNIIPESQVLRSRTQGYALNIHHLGYYATLTLINGHRFAPGGGEVTFVDPAMIPSIAIERVELVPDGASGVYGSDAVAGVVNFVYRRAFDGIESNLQYGWGHGSFQSLEASFLAGKKWDSGSLTFAFQFSRRTPPTSGELGLKGDNRDIGGADQRGTNCSPGNVTVDGKGYALPNFTTPTNRCEGNPDAQLYPEGSRYTGLILGRKQLTDKLEVNLEANMGYYSNAQTSGFTSILVDVPNTNPYFASYMAPYFAANPTSTATSVTIARNSDGLFPTRRNRGESKMFALTTGATYELPADWQANAFLHYSRVQEFSTVNGLNPVALQEAARGTTITTAFNPFGNQESNDPTLLAKLDDGYYTRNWARNELFEASLKFDGSLVDIGGGAVKAAVGVDFRQENVHQIQDFGTLAWTGSVRDDHVARSVYALFAELNVPLVGPDNAMPFVRSLQLAMSGRYDKYNTFSGKFNPKFGVNWRPIDDLALQGSWSKSFVAPNIGASAGSYLIPFPQQNQTAVGLGIINLIHIAGGASWLEPESATNWSLGAKYAPSWLPGLRLGLSYFHINYRNTQYQPQEGLSNPDFAQFLREKYPPGVILDVTPADVDALLQKYKFQGLFQPGIVWTTVTTSALVNAGTLYVRGFDFEASYNLQTGVGDFDVGMSGNNMTKYLFKLLPTVPPVSLLDTNRSPKWAWRSYANWRLDGVSANLTWNHTSSYRNFSVNPNERVKKFDTFDLRLAYELNLMKGMELSLRIQNLFDTKPPYYRSANGYDPNAASPLRRMWQVALRSRF